MPCMNVYIVQATHTQTHIHSSRTQVHMLLSMCVCVPLRPIRKWCTHCECEPERSDGIKPKKNVFHIHPQPSDICICTHFVIIISRIGLRTEDGFSSMNGKMLMCHIHFELSAAIASATAILYYSIFVECEGKYSKHPSTLTLVDEEHANECVSDEKRREREREKQRQKISVVFWDWGNIITLLLHIVCCVKKWILPMALFDVVLCYSFSFASATSTSELWWTACYTLMTIG